MKIDNILIRDYEIFVDGNIKLNILLADSQTVTFDFDAIFDKLIRRLDQSIILKFR